MTLLPKFEFNIYMKYLSLLYLVLYTHLSFGQAILPSEILIAYKYINCSPADHRDTILKKVVAALQNPTVLSTLPGDIKIGLQILAGEINYTKGKFDLSLRYLLGAQNTYLPLHPGQSHYYILTLLGKLYYQRGNHLISGQQFFEALRSDKVKNNITLENEIREYILRIYNILPTFNLTTDFFEKSIDIKQKLGDDRGEMMVTHKLTQLYYTKGEYHKCISAADKGIKLANELNDEDVYFSNTIEKINSLTRLGQHDQAKAELTKLRHDFNPIDFHHITRYETAWGNHFLALRDEKQALLHYTKALPNRAPLMEQYLYKHQAESFAKAGMMDKAYEIQNKYIAQLSESYLSSIMPAVIQMEEKSARNNLDEQIKYLNAQNSLKDTLLKNQKLLADALEAKNTIQQNQLRNQKELSDAMQREVILQKNQVASERKIQMVYGISSVALLLMGVWIYSLFHKQKNKNNIILKQSSDNEMLMKEVHHRVKNNLQIISSLLDMQSMSIKDPTAAEAIKESKNRVQSMALIHQNLYHDGNIRGIKIDDYLRHLANSLFDSYNIDANKTILVTDIEPLYLDVDTVVPLGIIVNELITNSIKYAFSNAPGGQVSILLKSQNEHLFFQIKDSGKGFAADWTPDSNRSFGYQLIKAFAKKLKAKLRVYNERGAVIELQIDKFKLAEV